MCMEVIWPATLCYCFPQLNLCLPLLLLLLLSVDDEYYSGGTAVILDDEDENEKAAGVQTRNTCDSFVRSLCVS